MMNRLSAKRILSTASVMVLNGNTTAYEDAIKLAIEALSTERPKGRWVWKCNKVGNGCHCVCSICGRAENKQEPFCNCGADMRGEIDD